MHRSTVFVSCTVLCVLAVLSAPYVVQADDVDDPDVIVLTDDNFDSTVNSEELMLVEFYAPWCGHCKHLAPEYAKAATELLSHDPPIRLGKVDATEYNALAGRFGVSGYPTLKVMRNGADSPYNGPRDADGIVSYMKKQVGPAAKPATSKAEVEAFINNPEEDHYIVGFFKSGSPSTLQSSFVLTSNAQREDHVFIKVVDEAVAKEFDIDGEAIVMFKNYDDLKTVYEGDTKPANLQAWIKGQSVPLVGVFDEKSSKKYFGAGLPVVKLFCNIDLGASNARHTKYFINRLRKPAEKYRGKMLFTLANREANAQEVGEYGTQPDVFVVIDDLPAQDKYLLEEKFSAKSVAAFVDKYFDNQLTKHVKSEAEPENNDGPVKVVTGKTFHDIVDDPEKDVLIEFYAPWCGHCKQLAPKYEELGKKMSKYENVVIAKLDATANDFPRSVFPVSGYPTIMFVPAKPNARPIPYEGDREVSGFRSFIKKNAGQGMKKRKKN
jgi:protein disulfide isomerase